MTTSPTPQMTLGELQTRIDRWMSQFEEGYWPPLANVARLAEEVGELAREVNHQFGPKKRKTSEAEGSIGDELGDIVFTVAVIANSLGLSLDEIMERNLAKVIERDSSRWKKKT